MMAAENRRASEEEKDERPILSPFREHAMKSFLSRFGSFVLFVLSGFDRLRLAGESRRLNHGRGVESYRWQQRIRFKDFTDPAQQRTDQLRQATEALAPQQDVPLLPLNSPTIDKEATARQLAQPQPGRCGRSAVLSCVESCTTYRLRSNGRGLIAPRKETARCLHYYHYFQHPPPGTVLRAAAKLVSLQRPRRP
jgi:hypothetical protein